MALAAHNSHHNNAANNASAGWLMLGVSAAEVHGYRSQLRTRDGGTERGGGKLTGGGGEGGIDKVLNMQKTSSEAVWVNRPELIIDALQTGLTRLT